MVTKLLRLGDKIDIRIVQQVENIEQTGISPRIYKSQVNDFADDGKIEITMPIEGGKVVLLPLGIRYEFVFYTNQGLYRAIGQINERYKKDNIYTYLIELHTPLKKFQRREFYRYPCLIDVEFFKLDKKAARKKSAEEIFESLRDDDFYKKQKQATILDLSGGGAKFIGENQLKPDTYILMIIRLCNGKIDQQYYIKSLVLSSEEVENRKEKFETRVQFVFQDNRVQEEIIKYIFEEERMGRRRK